MTQNIPQAPDFSGGMRESLPGASLGKRTGVFPMLPGASVCHRLAVPVPLNPALYATQLPAGTPGAIGRNLVKTAALAGAPMYLIVLPLSEHPEFSDHRRWVCCHAGCAGKEWQTEEDLVRAHPSARVCAQRNEAHAYFCAVEVPAAEDGSRGPVVMLLTPEEV